MNIIVPPTQSYEPDFQAELRSCLRTIALAVPGQELTVFKNIARELAGYVSKGLYDKQAIVDRLQDAASGKGLIDLHGQEVVQAAIAEAFAKPPSANDGHDSPQVTAPAQNAKFKLIRFSDLKTNVSSAYLIKG